MSTQVQSLIHRTTVVLTPELRERLTAFAEETDRPQSRIIRQFIEEGLDAHEGKGARDG